LKLPVELGIIHDFGRDFEEVGSWWERGPGIVVAATECTADVGIFVMSGIWFK